MRKLIAVLVVAVGLFLGGCHLDTYDCYKLPNGKQICAIFTR